MKFKRIIALILCTTLLVLTLAGCGEETPPIEGIDFDGALATFPPDTVMFGSGDLTMTWAEFYVVIFDTFSGLYESYGEEIPWDDDIGDNQTLSELALEFTTNEALTFLTYKYGLEISNFTLSEQELAEFRVDIEEYLEDGGGREAVEETLRESGFYSFDVFESFMLTEYSIGLLANSLYGEEGSLFPDESVAEYIANNDLDLLMAMHIIRLKTSDTDETPRTEIEEIYSRLTDHLGSDNFIDFFRDEMLAHSQDDGGLRTFPDGYLFLFDAMVSEFSEATVALRIGEMSDIVESDFGYHIILRLPINYDSHILTTDGESPGSFRQLVAANNFESTLSGWFESLNQNIEFTPEYHTIDLSEIFKVH